jgi:hypothetical protein
VVSFFVIVLHVLAHDPAERVLGTGSLHSMAIPVTIGSFVAFVTFGTGVLVPWAFAKLASNRECAQKSPPPPYASVGEAS